MSAEFLILVAIAVAVFAATLGLQFVGYRYGRRKAESQSDDARQGLSVVEGAVFALLGLMLAFQFAGAAGRLGDRRALAIKESNAIGTAYLRLELLAEEDARLMRELFRQYVEARIRATEALPDLDAALKEYAVAEKMLPVIWSKAVAFCKKEPGSEAELLLLPSINEMIDISEERKAVGQTHAPFAVQLFLVLLALFGGLLAGNAMSRSPRRPLPHMILFAAVLSITIYFILDMEYPRVGFIRIGAADKPIYNLRESMK